VKRGETGSLGEKAAAEYLLQKGLDILNSNYRTRYGEIDIIATDGRYIIFIEVKTRKEHSLISPREAVDYRKQAKIIKTAEDFLCNERSADKLQPRFDVIEVITADQSIFSVKQINQLENAFSVN
jgi:putative endonuclease